MTASVDKLQRKLRDRELAEALVAAGFENPAKIRKASDKALEKAVGKTGKDKIREKIKAR